MIHEKWFISDTHFCHDNIIKFCQRPFAHAGHMNQELIKRWNAVVGENDYVYHLGDVGLGFGGDEKVLGEVLWALKGRLRLIVGNHDNLKSPLLHKRFEKIELWKGFAGQDFTCTHMPCLLEGLRDGRYNAHGHIHTDKMKDHHYINLCVEHHDFTPVHMDWIVNEIKRRDQASKE